MGGSGGTWDNGSRQYGNAAGIRRIGDVPVPCSHPEHYPPSNMVFEPGIYEHTCPACGKRTEFTVPSVTV